MKNVFKKSLSEFTTYLQVHVNGMKFYTFSHRIPFDMVTTLAIVGDVTIYWLGFEVSKLVYSY